MNAATTAPVLCGSVAASDMPPVSSKKPKMMAQSGGGSAEAERAEESVPRNAVKKITKAQTLRTPRAEEVTAFVKSAARSFTSLGGSVLLGSASLGKTFFDEAIFIPILTVAAETRVAP